LRYLDYEDGDAAAAEGRSRMLRAAAKLRRLFLLPVPDAPSLVFFGGEADPAVLGASYADLPSGSLAGSGLAPQRAFEACVGEGIEYLSQFLLACDPIELGSMSERCALYDADVRRFTAAVLSACGIDGERRIDWLPARLLPAGTEVWFPADLCVRRAAAQQDFSPPLKLSTGCAAGATLEAATLRALLELIERDAVSLWWRGGRRGRSIVQESEAGRAGAELLAQLRQGSQERRSWLLEITTDLGVPAVASLSSRQDGYGFAFGVAARPSLAEAVRAAVFEMCQVELGLQVVAAKRHESGDEALNESERRQLRRGTLLDTRCCALLRPDGPRLEPPCDPATTLPYILERLAERGIAAFSLDLTRPDFGIPVVRVLAPGLQLEPCQIVGKRLERAISETGGGAMHTRGLSLL
jgi:ribosomal protein S12 methylthiotransferase accessory factor